MRKITKRLSAKMFAVAFILFVGTSLSAQDIIEINSGIDDQGKPTLYNAIIGDTLDNGDRAHPDAIYRLKRGMVYPSEGLFIDFDITVDALDGTDRPPMIIPFADANGDLPYALLSAAGENAMTFKNLLFSAVNNPAQKQLGQNGLVTKSGRTVIDNCIFNGFTGGGVSGQNSIGYDLHITNSVFRNIQNATAWWEGDAIMFWAAKGDSLVIENTTFFNCGGHIVNSNWENFYTDFFKFNNNTVYGGNFNVLTSMSQTNGVITNNLFVNAYAMGIDTSGQSAGWVVPVKGQTACIVPFGVNDAAKMLEELDLVEADRHMEVHNNVYYWSQGVKDHWDSRGAQFPETDPQFMNAETQAMFGDETAYPLLAESNNIEEDPMFTDDAMQADVIAGYAKYGNGIFDSFLPDGPAFDGYLHHFPGGDGVDDVFFNVEWPLAEDLKYTSTVLLTASSTGGPVGDLNWFGSTGIDSKVSDSGMELNTYPNPVNGAATISYMIENSSNVKLSIFDITGKELTVLVNEVKVAGKYSVSFTGAEELPSGVYLVKISTDTNTAVKRMVKL